MFAARDVFLTLPPGALASLSYSFSNGKPAGCVDVLSTAGAGASIISGVSIREGDSSNTTGGYNSHVVLPYIMGVLTSISVTVTVGSLGVVANNRSVGPGIFSADGSKGVYVRVTSQSATASLLSWQSGAETSQKTSTQVATAGDTITLTATLSAGVWTYTVKKNGGADIAAFTWADSAHVIDLPGNRPGIAFRHQSSGGQFPSRGVSLITAAAA